MAGPRTLEWMGDENGYLRLLDQTQLPTTIAYKDCHTVEDVWEAIKNLRVRGAPAIGVAAAFGVILGIRDYIHSPRFLGAIQQSMDYLRTSRPTAVNLAWALDRLGCSLKGWPARTPPIEYVKHLLAQAQMLYREDAECCHAIGQAGAGLIRDGMGVLTHCNAGGLATVAHGTALAVLFAAHDQGRRFTVFADETRPLLQGARLTAWELQQHGVPVTVICDSMAAQVMKEGRVQCVIVGADRIAANGDTANKIGTYGVAVLAQAHDIPFYVAAPCSTFDLTLVSGAEIPIEQRDPGEVTHGFGRQTAPDGVSVYNPAFDVTPARLIAGLITEHGIIRPVQTDAIANHMRRSPEARG